MKEVSESQRASYNTETLANMSPEPDVRPGKTRAPRPGCAHEEGFNFVSSRGYKIRWCSMKNCGALGGQDRSRLAVGATERWRRRTNYENFGVGAGEAAMR